MTSKPRSFDPILCERDTLAKIRDDQALGLGQLEPLRCKSNGSEGLACLTPWSGKIRIKWKLSAGPDKKWSP
jgi:hypothetical protein